MSLIELFNKAKSEHKILVQKEGAYDIIKNDVDVLKIYKNSGWTIVENVIEPTSSIKVGDNFRDTKNFVGEVQNVSFVPSNENTKLPETKVEEAIEKFNKKK